MLLKAYVVLYKLSKDIFEVCSKLKKGKVTSFSWNCNNCRGKKFVLVK
jgi:hypothetical protein